MYLFSVIIPLYNKALYVERALRSVLIQSEQNFEVVVVDDGSTDDGAQKIQSIRDSRIKLVQQDNHGVAVARNVGAYSASGHWLVFLDADDMWGRNHLFEVRRLINAFPDVGMVGTSYREVEEGGDISFLDGSMPGSLRLINYFDEARKHIGVINASNVTINSAVFKESGGFSDYKYGEDLEFWARLALEHPVAISDRATVVYYRSNGGAMENICSDSLPSSGCAPFDLSSVSPSVAMLASKLNDLPPNSKLYISVAGYINSRIVQGMRSALIRGDVEKVKALRSLFLQPLSGCKQFVWWSFSALPVLILHKVSVFRGFIKQNFIKLIR